MSWWVSPWVSPVRDSLYFLDLIDYLLSHVGEVFNYNLFKNFLSAFLFFFFLWDPYNSNVGAFNIVPKVSEVILNYFHSFHFVRSLAVISIVLSSSSLFLSSASVILLLVPSRVFFEWLHFRFSLSCIGEGNGNPFQSSCLEEPGGLPSVGSHRVGHD